MAFWSSAVAEPKRNFRWVVEFGGAAGLDGIRYAAKKVDKPKAKINEASHKYLNHFFYYPGRLEWETINITFASVTDPDATQALMNLLKRVNYLVPNDASLPEAERKTLGKAKFANEIGRMKIIQVGVEGQAIETWQLNNPFFTSVQFGSLDYGNEDIVEISTTVRYDWAELLALPTVVGAPPATPAGG